MRKWEKKTEDGIRKSECGSGKRRQRMEFGSRNAEVGKEDRGWNSEVGMRKWEKGIAHRVEDGRIRKWEFGRRKKRQRA
jgi:hypothetical protein